MTWLAGGLGGPFGALGGTVGPGGPIELRGPKGGLECETLGGTVCG